MTRPHRAAHRLVWPVIGVLSTLVIALALVARAPTPPAPASLPGLPAPAGGRP